MQKEFVRIEDEDNGKELYQTQVRINRSSASDLETTMTVVRLKEIVRDAMSENSRAQEYMRNNEAFKKRCCAGGMHRKRDMMDPAASRVTMAEEQQS